MNFSPYLMTQYPDPESYLKIVDFLVARGVTHIEAGVPFSDPAADGPVLTAINHTMTQQGYGLASSLKMLKLVHHKHPNLKICLMTYLNPVYQEHLQGERILQKKLQEAGIDSLLIPDLPLQEKEIIKNIYGTTTSSVKKTSIVSSNLDDETIKKIAKESTGFLYLLRFIGTTGNNVQHHEQEKNFVERVRRLVGPNKRLVLGFGIKTKEDIRRIGDYDLDGFIIGSALAQVISEEGLEEVERFLEEIGL